MPIPNPAQKNHNHLARQTLARLDEQLQDLPMLPMVITRLITINPDSDEYFDQLVSMAETDPSFAARILNMANSASSHPTQQIARIANAIVRIGSRSIANLISTIAVMRVFVPTTPSQRFLWIHAIEVAVCSRHIARYKQFKTLSEEAYLVGLLHDIGHFIMFDKAPEELAEIEASHWQSPIDVIQAEMDICGYAHPELGWHICRHWEIPNLVAQVVRYHHVYKERQFKDLNIDNDTRELIRIVQMGDILSTTIFRDAKWMTWGQQELESHLQEQALNTGWQQPPMNLKELSTHLGAIHAESEALVKELGIYPQS